VTLAEAPVAADLRSPRRFRRWRVIARPASLAIVALLLALTYILGFLLPLSYVRHPDIIPTDRPLADALGTDLDGALRFVIPVVIAFLLYGAAILLARGMRGRMALTGVLGVGLVYAAIFLPTNPVGAQDIYHNVFDARILWRYGDNPNAVPPSAYPDDPLFPAVVAWNEFASVYGPVWYTVSGIAYGLGRDSLTANVYGHKALTAAFLLGTALLAGLTADRIRHGTGVAAAIAVCWNPLMLFDTAGNAHNDIVMVFFAMAAFFAIAEKQWLWVFPLLALSVTTKYALILLGPLMLVWLLRRGAVPKGQIALSIGLGALVGLAVYLPFFQGAETLDVIRRQSGYNTSSPSALLDAIFIDRWGMHPVDSSSLMKQIVVPLFLVLYAWQVWRVRGDLAALVERSFVVLFLLLLIATWWFWPWYVLWIVPIVALLPYRGVALIGLLFSASAMLMYTAYFWLLYGNGVQLQAATSAVAFIPPVVAGIGYLVWRAARDWRERPGESGALTLVAESGTVADPIGD
jgi:energy-converting hydrogenase Eha subunit F